MADVLTKIVQAGGGREVYALTKGRTLKNTDGSERINIVCVRDTPDEAQQLANQFENAQRFVMFLEYLSAIVIEHGGSAELATVTNPTTYVAFLTKYGFNKPDQPRLYNVQRIKISKKLDDGEAAPAAEAK